MIRDGQRRGRAALQVGAALAVMAAGFFIAQSPALAATDGFFVEGRQFYSIDLESGTSEVIGTTGVDERFSSLAFAPDGTLYAVADAKADVGLDRQPEPAELYTIDVATGAATLIGMLSENNDTGMVIAFTALTFSDDGVALMSGLASGALDTVFVLDIEGTSGSLVPVSRLKDDTGFVTLATDTACDGTILGLSLEVPERLRDTTNPATVSTLPSSGQLPGTVGTPAVDRVRAQPAPPGVPPAQQPDVDDSLPIVLTTIDPATGATTEIGPTGLGANEFNIPGIAIDRADDETWGVVLDGEVFTIDDASGAADLTAGTTATDIAGARRPQNLAISPVSCSQPTTTTSSTTTTTTSTTSTTVATPSDPPPARPATPVPAQPTFTG